MTLHLFFITLIRRDNLSLRLPLFFLFRYSRVYTYYHIYAFIYSRVYIYSCMYIYTSFNSFWAMRFCLSRGIKRFSCAGKRVRLNFSHKLPVDGRTEHVILQ